MKLQDLPAGVKYHKIHLTKKAKTEDEGKKIFPAKSRTKKGEKNDFKACSQYAFMSHTSSLNNIYKEDC